MIAQTVPIRTIRMNEHYLRVKRIIDIAFALLVAPVVLLVGILIALCIKLDSRGPVFFQQRRIGQDGRAFRMLKFRSMYMNSEQNAHKDSIIRYMQGEKINADASEDMTYKIVNDPRITRVGRFIRKTSLDELPQFWNVLRGEMTLVGPRPPLPYEVDLYGPYEQLRLIGKPGLTGPWQIYGRSRVTFQSMVEMDIGYLEHQSHWQDFKLIVLTIPVMIFARGGA